MVVPASTPAVRTSGNHEAVAVSPTRRPHGRSSRSELAALENPEGECDPALLELLQERRPQARGEETAHDRAVARHLVDLELEQLLQRDHVGLHPLHLGDRRDAAGAVLEPLEVDDQSSADATCWRIARIGRS